jgi:hypothetical protein
VCVWGGGVCLDVLLKHSELVTVQQVVGCSMPYGTQHGNMPKHWGSHIHVTMQR